MDINGIYKSIIKNYLGIDQTNIKELQKYKQSVKQLRNSYKADICKPMYNTHINRDSYMLSYFPYYSMITSEVIKKIQDSINISHKLNISIFGCGPAPELLGISNEIDYKRINYNLFDYEIGWERQREFAKQYVRDNYNGQCTFCEISGCDLLTTCKDCDIVDSKCIDKIKSTNLFIMQNCLNHIINEEDFTKKISFIIKNARSGAVFIFIDLKYEISRKIIDEIYEQNNNICIKIDCKYNEEFRISKEEIDSDISENLFTGEKDLILKTKVKYIYLAIKKI